MTDERRVVRLTEHRATRLSSGALTEEQGIWLLAHHGGQFDVSFPTPSTRGEWVLTSTGYVGLVAVPDGPILVVDPKVAVHNIARMLAEVYSLEIHDAAELLACTTLPELYEQLLRVLAKHVLILSRAGLHQSYQHCVERLSALRGRIDLSDALRDQADVRLRCHYDERTGDIPENQIPLGTIDRLLRAPIIRSDFTRQSLREAFRRLANVASVRPVTSADFSKLQLTRLTERYRTVIALCRLILDLAAPSGDVGTTEGVPFLLYMPDLFERYVTARLRSWGRAHGHLLVSSQEHWPMGGPQAVPFYIDLVVREADSGRVACVLDTKYKDHSTPSADDVAQVGYYALATRASHAFLVYPTNVPNLWRGQCGSVSIERVPFDLSGDLDIATEHLTSIVARASEPGLARVRAS